LLVFSFCALRIRSNKKIESSWERNDKKVGEKKGRRTQKKENTCADQNTALIGSGGKVPGSRYRYVRYSNEGRKNEFGMTSGRLEAPPTSSLDRINTGNRGDQEGSLIKRKKGQSGGRGF